MEEPIDLKLIIYNHILIIGFISILINILSQCYNHLRK